VAPLRLSVILPTHNPNPVRLERTLQGLLAQSFPATSWELLVIDNASSPPLVAPALAFSRDLRIVREEDLGLTSARQRGFREARGDLIVMVDDDNVLAPDYLATVVDLFDRHPQVGAMGGKSLPEFEVPPPAWTREFHGLLALRDLGETPLVSTGLRPDGAMRNQYPAFSPIGAGMALRRRAVQAWLDATGQGQPSDRRGGELTSGGDNDIVLCAMKAGWEVGYFPSLSLIHLIPAARVQPDYLARLNRGIQKSWVQVLARHDANPWPAIASWTVPFRKVKNWLTYRAWTGSVARIRWHGACGHFEGRSLNPIP